jgi:isopenicillin-N N-acyltransferase-like protein
MLIDRIIKRGDTIPLIAFSGSAYECGRQYAASTLRNYPAYAEYLKQAVTEWTSPAPEVAALFNDRAPYIADIYRGMLEVLRDKLFLSRCQKQYVNREECTSYSLAPGHCAGSEPISGQTKDTHVDRLQYYTVLRLRLSDGPTILVLAYPGEVLGYGLWSNGNTLFRNDLKSQEGNKGALSATQFGLLALASPDIAAMVELAREYGVRGAGNFLFSDSKGDSVSVEFNAGGVDFVYPENGILVHANHPLGEKTAAFEDYPDEAEKKNSRYRQEKFSELLYNNTGSFDRDRAFACMADHSAWPRGICRHIIGEREDECTTAALVAEPAAGRLSICKGPACLNDYVTYSI